MSMTILDVRDALKETGKTAATQAIDDHLKQLTLMVDEMEVLHKRLEALKIKARTELGCPF